MQQLSGKIINEMEGVTSTVPSLTNSNIRGIKMAKSNLPNNQSTIKICTVKNCESKHLARGFCRKHYKRVWRHQSTNALRNRGVGNTEIERFWNRIAITADDHRCWEWQAAKVNYGYGTVTMTINGIKRARRTHVAAWELTHNKIARLEILHSCDNPPCCNPNHLREDTHAENMRDAVKRGRTCKGEKQGRSKLTESQVLEIRKANISGESQRKIAIRFGVSHSMISRIITNRNWTHI